MSWDLPWHQHSTLHAVHKRKKERKKRGKEKIGENETDGWRMIMVQRMRKGKEGGKKNLSGILFCPMIYLYKYFTAFRFWWTTFVFITMKQESDLNICTPKIIFIHFQPLITLFNFNHIKWCGPKMLLLPWRNVTCVWDELHKRYTQVHIKCNLFWAK